jgi:hypothetical protein
MRAALRADFKPNNDGQILPRIISRCYAASCPECFLVLFRTVPSSKSSDFGRVELKHESV